MYFIDDLKVSNTKEFFSEFMRRVLDYLEKDLPRGDNTVQKIYVKDCSGSCNSNFDQKCLNLEIGVLSDSDFVGHVLLYLLNIMKDKFYDYVENTIDLYFTFEEDNTRVLDLPELLEYIVDQEIDEVMIFANEGVNITHRGVREWNGNKFVSKTIIRNVSEIELWDIPKFRSYLA